MILETALADTQAALDRENEGRRAAIRKLLAESAALNKELSCATEHYIKTCDYYPPRGWDERWRRRLEEINAEVWRLASDIASLSAVPGYFVVNAIEAWMPRRILEEIG